MNNEAFTTTFVVLGEVSNGIDSVKDVRTELIYSKVGQILAKGIFYGDEETSRTLGRILLSGKAYFCGVWSPHSTSFDISFHVKNINFDRYEGRDKTDKLCEFTCGELEAETSYHLGGDQSNKIEKLLIRYGIPKRRELFLPKFPEEWKKKLPEYRDWLEFETTLGAMKIERRTYSRMIAVESKRGLFSFDESILSFEVPAENRDLNEVLMESEHLVEDYLKLISFILQCETKYYKQEVIYLNFEKQELKNILRLVQRTEVKAMARPILFELGTVDKLLKELMPMFSTHISKEDIAESILLFLGGIQSNYSEVRLILMQSAIETIANNLKRGLNLPIRHCEVCNSDLIPLKESILQVVSSFILEIEDIYPSVLADNQKTFPFIKYRNAIAHGRRNEIDYKDLSSELYRQQLLLERLIFHWIGFDARKVKYLKLWEGVKSY
jgi:hypothetical protein